MKNILASWPKLAGELAAGDPLLLGLDYDGTLAPIVRNPADARMSRATRASLEKLCASPRLFAAVISGRTLADIRQRMGIPNVIYGGNHGLELSGPGWNYLNPCACKARNVLRETAKKLAEKLRGREGVILEDKHLTLTVHFRKARETEESLIRAEVEEILAPFRARRQLRLTEGKKVLEIRPPTNWGKGNALRLIQRRLASRAKVARLRTLYIGDDRTDEAAFAALGKGDFSVRVGKNQATAARWSLAGVGEVRKLLNRLENCL